MCLFFSLVFCSILSVCTLFLTSFDVGNRVLIVVVVVVGLFLLLTTTTHRQRLLSYSISAVNTPKKNHTSRTESNMYVMYICGVNFRHWKYIDIYHSLCVLTFTDSHTSHKHIQFSPFAVFISSAPVVVVVLLYSLQSPHSRRRAPFYQILHFINHIQHLLPCTVSFGDSFICICCYFYFK